MVGDLQVCQENIVFYFGEMKRWERRILRSTSVLMLVLIAMFLFQMQLQGWTLAVFKIEFSLYVRFLIVSPIVFYLTFCVRQYLLNSKLHNYYRLAKTKHKLPNE